MAGRFYDYFILFFSSDLIRFNQFLQLRFVYYLTLFSRVNEDFVHSFIHPLLLIKFVSILDRPNDRRSNVKLPCPYQVLSSLAIHEVTRTQSLQY